MLIVREEEVGGSEMHEMATSQHYTSSLTSLPLPVSTGQDVSDVAQLESHAQAEGVTSTSLCHRIQTFILFQLIEYGGSDDHGINIDQPQRDYINDPTSDTPHAGQGWIQAVDSGQSVDSSTRHSTSDSEIGEKPQENRLIGDFDGSANALWTLYGKEAKSYDDARINTLKDDMDGVLIFVRSYSIRAYCGLGHTDV